jgi:hypothetical protein
MRLNLFTPGKKVTVIGAISIKRVVALMTMDNSMDGKAFEVFIEQCLVPQLWSGAVVVMDNLPAHKVDLITSMIESVGASIATAKPVKTFLIAETIAITASSFFLLPTSIGLLLYLRFVPILS